jgi:hypothetical protein
MGNYADFEYDFTERTIAVISQYERTFINMISKSRIITRCF